MTVESSVADRLEAYYRLLATWNQRINLTALNLDSLPDEAVDRLFIEPLAAARFAQPGSAVLDVGSGGGSPAIPFALATGASTLTMVESKARKSVFLREAARAAGIVHSDVVTARFQTVAESADLTGAFEVVTVRAVRIDEDDWPALAGPLRSGGSLFFLHRSQSAVAAAANLSLILTNALTAHADVSIFRRL